MNKRLRKRDIAITTQPRSSKTEKYTIFVLTRDKTLKKLMSFVERSNLGIKELLRRINSEGAMA